jgi:hypothetical protein
MFVKDVRERCARARGFSGFGLAPGGGASLQSNAEIAQGSKYFAYLSGILSLFDLGNPGLRGPDCVRQFGLGHATMAARRDDDFADVRG